MEGDCNEIKVNKNINLCFIDETLPILFSILYKNNQNLSLFEEYLELCVCWSEIYSNMEYYEKRLLKFWEIILYEMRNLNKISNRIVTLLNQMLKMRNIFKKRFFSLLIKYSGIIVQSEFNSYVI